MNFSHRGKKAPIFFQKRVSGIAILVAISLQFSFPSLYSGKGNSSAQEKKESPGTGQTGDTTRTTYLTFRSGDNLSAEALDLLEKYTKPKIVISKPHESIDQILNRIYGNFGKSMKERVKTLNPSYPDAGSETPVELKMPAGPYIQNNIKVPLKKPITVTELNAVMGMVQDPLIEIHKATKGSRVYESTRVSPKDVTAYVSPSFVDLPEIVKLESGSIPINPKLGRNKAILINNVTFLSVPRYVSFELKESATTNIKFVEEAVSKMTGINDVSTGNPMMILPVGLAITNGKCEGKPPKSEKWFAGALSLDKADFLRVEQGRNQVTVAFLDTGVGSCTTDDGSILPDIRFNYWKNRDEATLETSGDDDGDLYKNDIHGVDVTAKGRDVTEPFNIQNPQRDISNDDRCMVTINAMHGTHIAGILSGICFPDDFRKITRGRLKLLPIKITDDDRNLYGSAVQEALRVLEFHIDRSQEIRVVNMSIADAVSGSAPYAKLIGRLKSTLFIAAAGNVHPDFFGSQQIDLNDKNRLIYPAMLPQNLENVITVAALGEDGNLADFSYFGNDVVDLAAPGEGILSTVKDFDEVNNPKALAFASGTSQAAPFVSLTASLLFLMGFTDVADVRRRIICSTDFRPSLRDYVWSSGSLNIAKALAIYDDVIQVRGPNNGPDELVKGVITHPLNISVLMPGPDGKPTHPAIFPIEQVRKIMPNYWQDPSGKMWSAIIVTTNNMDETRRPLRKLRIIRCQLEIPDSLGIVLDLGDKLDTKVTSIKLSDVVDITICDPVDPYTRAERKNRVSHAVQGLEDRVRNGIVPLNDIR